MRHLTKLSKKIFFLFEQKIGIISQKILIGALLSVVISKSIGLRHIVIEKNIC